MKVLIVACLIFGVAQATLPGFGGGNGGGSSGSESSSGGGSNILGDIVGAKLGIIRFLREQTSRLGGGGESDQSSKGEVVDGTGAGIPGAENHIESSVASTGAGSASSGNSGYNYQVPETIQQGYSADGGYSYSAVAPQANYGPPQTFSNVAPAQNYAQPQPNYGPPQTYSNVAPAQNYAQPQPNYGPPQIFSNVASQQNYAQPQQNYGPPQSYSGVASQGNFLPQAQPESSYLSPQEGHSSGGHASESSSGISQTSEVSSSSSSGSSSGGSSFDLSSIVKLGTGIPLSIIERGKSAGNKHWDRKSNAVNSIAGLLTGLLGGSSSNSDAKSDSSSVDLDF